MFTLKELTKATEEMILERGADYIYTSSWGCRYTNPATGDAGCIVGGIIQKIDPEKFEALKKFERENNASCTVRSLLNLGFPSIADFTDWTNQEGFVFLTNLQRYQDCRRPWGASYKVALEAVAVMKAAS